MKPDTIFLLALLSIAAGFTLGAFFGGFLSSKTFQAIDGVRHIADVSQKNFNAIHDRLLKLEGKVKTEVKKLAN